MSCKFWFFAYYSISFKCAVQWTTLSNLLVSTITATPFYKLKACSEMLDHLSIPQDKFSSLLSETRYLFVHEFPSSWQRIPSQVSWPDNRVSLHVRACINDPNLLRLCAKVPGRKCCLEHSLPKGQRQSPCLSRYKFKPEGKGDGHWWCVPGKRWNTPHRTAQLLSAGHCWDAPALHCHCSQMGGLSLSMRFFLSPVLTGKLS